MQPTTEPTTAAEPDAPEPRRWAFRAFFGAGSGGSVHSITFEIPGLSATAPLTALKTATRHMAVATVDGFVAVLRRGAAGDPRPARLRPSQIFMLEVDDRATELMRFEDAAADAEARRTARAAAADDFEALVDRLMTTLADPAEAELAALGTATAALGDRFAHSAGA